MLVALLVCSLFSMGASAESISPVSDEAAYAKYFPEGVPDYLNDEQIQQVLNGQYLSVVVNDEIITYNPENNPAYAIGQTRAGQTVWDEDLTKTIRGGLSMVNWHILQVVVRIRLKPDILSEIKIKERPLKPEEVGATLFFPMGVVHKTKVNR